ncbi:hypothetical protein P4361_20300 [Fictibacillus sp. B-59209]|uniref:hypothetical protein n=1 Tax=Fictibacillus sp. B-59209 TaxID=3024873 RepID=UPI002E20A130|nr:hypothetical protein [Fictibacillus sp. B-59209]
MNYLKYYILLIIGTVIFIYNDIAAGIVGGKMVLDDKYKDYLVFSNPPYTARNISEIDKILYSAQTSGYPYIAIIALIFIVVVIVMMRKNKSKNKNGSRT